LAVSVREKLAGETKDPLEVVPAEDSVYIFVGKPPKKFGIAWIEQIFPV
jgi:hypothetical protein